MSSRLGDKHSAWVCLWPMAVMIAFKSGIQSESRWACNLRSPGRIWPKVEVCGVPRDLHFHNLLYVILIVYNQWFYSCKQLSPLKYCWLGQPHSFTKGTPRNAGNPFHKSYRNLITMQLSLPIEMQESCSWHSRVGTPHEFWLCLHWVVIPTGNPHRYCTHDALGSLWTRYHILPVLSYISESKNNLDICSLHICMRITVWSSL